MNIKKLIGAAAAASIAAASLFAVSASAAPRDIPLNYVDSYGAALSSYDYRTDSDDTYTLDDTSQAALKAAKAGDTLTITYNISANGTAKYRGGLNIAGGQVYVNSAGTNGVDKSFRYNAMHLNGDLNTDNTALIELKYTIGENGSATIDTSQITVGSTTNSYSTGSKSISADFSSLTLNTQDRDSTNKKDFNVDTVSMSNFKAVLTTTAETPSAVSDVTAVPTTDDGNKYVFSGEDGWYAKAFQFNVTPGTNTVRKINVTAGEKSESREVNITSDEGTSYVYGIIIGSQDETALNKITADDIQVTTE